MVAPTRTDAPSTRVRPLITAPRTGDGWRTFLSKAVSCTDALVIVFAVVAARFAFLASHPGIPVFTWREPAAALLAVTWIAILRLGQTRSLRVLGTGVDEFARVTKATLWVFGLTTIAAVFLEVDYARTQLSIALPAGLAGLIVSRILWRFLIRRGRSRGEFKTPALVVGDGAMAAKLVHAVFVHEAGEFRIAGVCRTDREGQSAEFFETPSGTVPLFSGVGEILSAADETGAGAVVISSAVKLGPSGMKQLAWELEQRDARVVIVPESTDIALSRTRMRSIGDIPALDLDKPKHMQTGVTGKSLFDRTFAVLALIVFLPVLILTAIAIKGSSRGPIFYRSERIGLNGRPFQMIKFRSMVRNAEELADLMIAEEGVTPLCWKVKDDPRVTTVGRFIRRFSVDELPQFVNVLRGDMSIVGPRPQVRREVALYDAAMSRRLLVKPGCTGLWQVSGRNNLTPDDAMRLDQYYVDNWSIWFDLWLIMRTIKAVLKGHGAY